MFTNVLVGVDHHHGANDAIALAKQLSAEGATLTLAHVYAGDPYVYRGVSAEYQASVRDQDLEFLATAQAENGLQACTRWHESSSVGQGLHELCDEIDADVLVVGASARRHLGRVLPGDDARGALDGAQCAVAVAPRGYGDRPHQFSEIGIAYDGSPESDRGVCVAKDAAAACGSRLSALYVIWLPLYVYGGPVADRQDQIDEMMRFASERIDALGGVEAHVAAGIPVEELTLYSERVDLLVVGSRGYGPLGRMIHGSTAQNLARTAHCPLLVVPRAACLPATVAAGAVPAGADTPPDC
ncbi:MAG TPA: universal stress protein [Solirubrobacteraceae bacterium]|nr:universal stress protein [Solirubrobacteraceae bacterium]